MKKKEKLYRAEFVVLRESNEEMTMATVQALVIYELTTDRAFVGALKKALTAWVVHTEEGQRAWTASSQDYNIGDLAGDWPNREIGKQLKRVGIYQLKIDTLSETRVARNWVFDTILMDGVKISDEATKEGANV